MGWRQRFRKCGAALLTRILSIDPHILTFRSHPHATANPKIHCELDIHSTHIHDDTINNPAAINDGTLENVNDARARNREATAKNRDYNRACA